MKNKYNDKIKKVGPNVERLCDNVHIAALYSKRIYSANVISRSIFSSHKCLFKTYKNAFKWNVSNWD